MATSKKTAGKIDVRYDAEQTSNAAKAIANMLADKGIDKRLTKEVTSSTWKWEDGTPKYFKVLGVPIKQLKRQGSTMEPPTTVPVRNLDTGEHCSLLVNTMLLNQFASFNGEEIIGRCFISCRYAVEGKVYKGFDTISVPDPEETTE
jgi:hypothetical protein